MAAVAGQPAAVLDEEWMRRALALAERGRVTVSPNPLVGCVLVRDAAVVGTGFHRRAGTPHAEIVALGQAGDRAAGATAYVTLEPCAHRGRTGPCADALVEAGVRRVVAALPDPHPLAAGGADVLRRAGVTVEVGCCEEDARRQNEVFLHGVRTGRPFVVVKSAVSLDGRVAAADGTARWLTGPKAREDAHRLRAEVDAVVVGSGTVLAARGRTSPGHAVCDAAAATVVFTASHASGGRLDELRGAGVEVVRVAAAPGGGVALDEVLAHLWEREVRSVLVEGGPTLATAFLAGRLADRLEIHVAPLLLGAAGRPMVTGEGPTTLAQAPRFVLDRVEHAGADALLRLYPGEGAA